MWLSMPGESSLVNINQAEEIEVAVTKGEWSIDINYRNVDYWKSIECQSEEEAEFLFEDIMASLNYSEKSVYDVFAALELFRNPTETAHSQ
jgi:hypothetical protein